MNKELKIGKKIEQEHSATIKQIIKDAKSGQLKPLEHYFEGISKDHLKEIKDYYTRLLKMEKEAKKSFYIETDKLLKSKDSMKEKLISFFKKNPNPSDDKVHEFAEQNGIEPDDLEEIIYSMLTSRLKRSEEVYFIIDIMKGRPHKYIRKYRRGGKWIYIYHEGDKPGRELNPEVIDHIKEMAKLGDRESATLHATVEPHDEEKLNALRELTDLGDVRSDVHLRQLGIVRNKERLEEQLVPAMAQPEDELDQKLSDTDMHKIISVMQTTIGSKVFDYLNNYATSPFSKALLDNNITVSSLTNNIDKKTVRGALEALHENLKKMDSAHKGMTPNPSSPAALAGGYSNLAYNSVVSNLEGLDIGTPKRSALPEGFSEVHKRTPTLSVPKASEIRHQREERMRQIKGTAGYFLANITKGAEGVTASNKLKKADEINTAIRGIFGRDLTKEEFPYNFEDQGLKVTVESISTGRDSLNMEFSVKDKDGNVIVAPRRSGNSGWVRQWSKRDGKPYIYNSYLKVESDARNGAKLGSLVNQSQRTLLKSIGSGKIAVHAALEVGAYNWANQGFEFDSSSTLNSYRSSFKSFASGFGINLSEDDMNKFKAPVHFAAFDDGKLYTISTGRMPLTQEQIRTRSLSGEEGKNTLSASELRSGKTSRMMVHLGKKFMLGRDWSGTWDAEKETEASRYAEQYVQIKKDAIEQLSEAYKKVVKETKEGGRGTTTTPSRERFEVTEPTRGPPSGSSRVTRWIQEWAPRSGRNIRLTESRLLTLKREGPDAMREFLRTAPLAYDARMRLRDVIFNVTR